MEKEQYYQDFLCRNLYPRALKSYPLEKLINFSSNDYLGLSRHPLLIARAHDYMKKYGIGAASSRSVTGNFPVYEVLENKLAQAIGKPAALILGAGFQANVAVLDALLDEAVLGVKPVVLCDRLTHASLLLGLKSSKPIHRFQHNNLDHLAVLLEKYSKQQNPTFIIAESLYSMDGDYANIEGLITLAEQYNAILYIDDAHAVGVDGSDGWGKAALHSNNIDIIMGTFSKALGSFGSYITCSETIRDYLINKCKGLIYSTGLSPAMLGAMEAALELLPELKEERKKLVNYSAMLRDFMKTEGLSYGNSNSHIVPWIIGEPETTLQASRLLLEKFAILGACIRPPSVPMGQCRIRFCLSAAHTEEHMNQLLQAIKYVSKSIQS